MPFSTIRIKTPLPPFPSSTVHYARRTTLLLQSPNQAIIITSTMNKRPAPMSSHSSSWACTRCTFLNPPSQKSICQICLSPPPPSSSSSSLVQLPRLSSSSPPQSAPKWPCKACTFLNPYNISTCKICDTRAPFSTISAFEEWDFDNPDDPSDASVGSVFFPLRRCSAAVLPLPVDNPVGKRPSPPVESALKRKVVEVSDDDGGGGGSVDEKRDAFTGFRGVKSAKIAPVFENPESSKSLKSAVENVDADPGLGKIKILTYNVWFREDLEMHRRMKAIGDLIQLHAPDVICFQEITPDIYETFQCCSWWKKYQCSISPGEFLGGYFCMQLAKLPVKSLSRKPFSYTAMGRELCTAEVQVEGDKSLVIATSHLESPCPGPPTWDQMFSKERVAQAKEAISVLRKHQNVIFCGDMNWDDKLDGEFPCPEGWIDAWTTMRPGESGLTYDTKSNKMLSTNRTLQKRLDRFICSLRDFKVCGIEMIGMEAIPGLSYIKEKKTRKGIEKLSLPVLPSDHFGLLLTITGK